MTQNIPQRLALCRRSGERVRFCALSPCLWRVVGVCLLCLVASTEVWAWSPLVVGGRCRQSGDSCFATIGNAGQNRGACCDPLNRNIAQCVANNPCVGGNPYRWDDSRLPLAWSLNTNNMEGREGYKSLTADEMEKAAVMAWDAWTKPSCTVFRHRFLGRTETGANTEDDNVVVVLANAKEWAEMGQDPSTLAFTRPIPGDKGRMRDADILLSPRTRENPWRILPNTGLDLVKVLSHEVGHALGLAHTHLDALMYFANQPGKFQGLGRDDNDAICFTYPKKICTEDNECGGCRRCENGKCVERTIPPTRNLCQPCKAPDECGGNFDICVRFEDGNRCAQACDDKGCCPRGYRCAAIGQGQTMCIPETGQCPDVACQADSDCGPGEECADRVCRPRPVPPTKALCRGCASDKDCGADHSCISFPQGIKRCAMKCVADNFCPPGFLCRLTPHGRFCFPDQWLCPCTQPNDCWTGETCSNNLCRPRDCGYGCVCGKDARCPDGFQCAATSNINICVQQCGRSARFAPGTPGNLCDNSGTCRQGATCTTLSHRGEPVCLAPCQTSTDCRKQGGLCYSYRGQSFCMCRSDGECLGSQKCNTSVLGEAGAGVCATPRKQPPACPGSFFCRSIGSVDLCLPQTGDTGQPCNDTRPCQARRVCARTSSDNDDGVCLELCAVNQRCLGGGVCVLELNNNAKACGCQNDQQCLVGQTCSMLIPGAGFCKGELATHCGNGTCESNKNEHCLSCPADCGCKPGNACVSRQCQPIQSCGDGTCDPLAYENCTNCPKDCTCPLGQECRGDRCLDREQADGGTPDARCPGGEITVNDDGEVVCVQRPCGCQSTDAPTSFAPWLLALLLWGWRRRRRASSPLSDRSFAA